MTTRAIKHTNFLITFNMLIVYFAVTGWDNLFAVVYLFALTMSPLVMNTVVTAVAKARASHIVLLCTTVAYFAWASYLYIDVTYFSSDGQAGFALLLTAIAASPFLLIAWIACLVIEIRDRRRNRDSDTDLGMVTHSAT